MDSGGAGVGRRRCIHFCVYFVSFQYVADGLRALGHKVEDWKYFFNVVNAVEKENGCIAAVSDSRKMGVPAGY